MFVRQWTAAMLGLNLVLVSMGSLLGASESCGSRTMNTILGPYVEDYKGDELGYKTVTWGRRAVILGGLGFGMALLGGGSIAYAAKEYSNQVLTCPRPMTPYKIPFCFDEEGVAFSISQGVCPTGTFLALSQAVAQEMPESGTDFYEFTSLVTPKNGVVPTDALGHHWTDEPFACYQYNLTVDDLMERFSSGGDLPPPSTTAPVTRSGSRFLTHPAIRYFMLYVPISASGAMFLGSAASAIVWKYYKKKLSERDGDKLSKLNGLGSINKLSPAGPIGTPLLKEKDIEEG